MNIIKRDGSEAEYDKKKIIEAIHKAFASVNKTIDFKVEKEVNKRIKQKIKAGAIITVDRIQNDIEYVLLKRKHIEVAKSFIAYRAHRASIRKYAETKQKFIKDYVNAYNTADATIDANSNIGNKNVAVLNAEAHKEDNLEINRYLITQKLKELYPKFDYKSYKRDLESHIIYKHDENSMSTIAPYCMACSLDTFLKTGLKEMGGLSACPKNLDSFCGIYVNLVFALSSQVLGAVATPSFFVLFDYFAKKEWGGDYMENLEKVAGYKTPDGLEETVTVRRKIEQLFQLVIYTINQPAGNRSYQSPFTNFAYFDKPYFEVMYGKYMFPDGSYADFKSISPLQKLFMQWFNEERTKCMLTFPVESVSLLYKDGEYVDKDWADFVAEEYARGHSFFTYISDSVDSLSSCCFSGSEVIKLYNKNDEEFYITIKDFVNSQTSEISDMGEKKYTEYKVDSYNLEGVNEKVPITGILKKKYTGKMYKLQIGDSYIEVTADHPLMVKCIESEEIKEILTEEFVKNPDLYLLASKII